MQRKDGSVFFTEIYISEFISGGRKKIIGFVRDISERINTKAILDMHAVEFKKVLDESLKSREIMVSMLDDNNLIREKLEPNLKELKTAQSMLVQSEKLASIGKLVSDMAHEVNNPLMVISGRAQLSLMDEIKDKELEDNFKIIIDQCERAKEIIQRLLVFSKPSKGEIKDMDVNAALDFVVKLVEHQYSLQDIKFVRDLSNKLSLVSADDKQIHEVFMNIVKNAAEAMVDGGTITISTKTEAGFVKICFKDTGEGINEESLKSIFDPFFTTKEKGTGLGLSVCYGIIQAHNGELKYESEVGKGTIAIVSLPIKKE